MELHLKRADEEVGRYSLCWRDDVLRSQVGKIRPWLGLAQKHAKSAWLHLDIIPHVGQF